MSSFGHDLAIGRRLVAGTASAEDIADIGEWLLARRAPFLGRVFARLGDPALRTSVLVALGGCRGVPAMRAIVAALGDEPAALGALRTTASDAPYRWTHALFHGDASVRRAAIPLTPNAANEMLAYLRADPACRDLVEESPWPKDALPLAFDLHANDHLSDRHLAGMIAVYSPTELRAFFEAERGRSADEVEALLAQAETGTIGTLPGIDVVDQAFAATAGAGVDVADRDRDPQYPSRWSAAKALDNLMDAVVTKKPGALTRRAAASLLLQLGASPLLVGACVALEPRVLGFGVFRREHAAAAAAGLIRFKWPVRLNQAQVTKLLALPMVREDLALAVSVAGLYSGSRLKLLAKTLGEATIIERLLASDHGWDEICRLPVDSTALELAWLAKIEQRDHERYVALAAVSLLALFGKRLEQFIDLIPRRHRERVFRSLVERSAHEPTRIAIVCRTFASRLDRTQLIATFSWLLAEQPPIALVLGRAVEAKALAAVARELSDELAQIFVGLLDGPDPLPRDRELALAAVFATSKHPVVGEWGRRVSALPVAQLRPNVPAVRAKRALDAREQQQIATCTDAALETALEPALYASVTGLCEPLAKRVAVINPLACAALLGCADPMVDVATQLERFSGTSREFGNALDSLAGGIFHRAQGDLSPFLHARMYRWEAHDYALARWLEQLPSVVAALEIADALPGRFAARTLWAGIAEVIVFLRYRDPERFTKMASSELAMYCAERIDRDIGVPAARIVVSLVESRTVDPSHVKNTILDRAADADALTREFLVRIARLEGMPAPPAHVDTAQPSPELFDRVKACTDPEQLLVYCTHQRRTIVQEAALQLLLLGEQGQLLLATLLPKLHELAAPVPILASIELWDSEQALAAARALGHGEALIPEWQFHLCMSLVKRGDDLIDRAFAAARANADTWFRRSDWEKLVEIAGEERCAIALSDSPHHHAYQPAVRALLETWDVLPAYRDALARFLEADANRPLMLRRDVARRLITEYADYTGLLVLVDEVADDKTDEGVKFLDKVAPEELPAVAEAIVSAALLGGDGACSERRMWEVIQRIAAIGIPAATLAPLYARILEEASTSFARRNAAPYVVTEIEANAKLRDVAEVFAWGTRRGVELTGKLFRIHMTSDERDFGYTHLDSTKLYVSPLAMLRGEMYGRDIVEGLVLHEIGHHTYHATKDAQTIWKRAHDEKLGRLLNLVADEHLERNLRGVDPAYGDRLKRLGAYAFQHAALEIRVAYLLDHLRGSAGPALIATPLEVAFDEGSVRVRRGAMLAELDRAGHPLARFARALRLGLGNRHRDPRIEAALALCGRELRRLDMAGLYELTKKLAAMFGGAIGIANVFGGPEDLVDSERERDLHGAGIDDDVLQREVERILEPKKGKKGAPGEKVDRLQINVNPDQHFERIHSIQRVRGNPETHNRIATVIARHSTRLRAHLDELGLRWERQNARIQGHTLDRSRLRALVTRNDPRILVARTPLRRTDLFLGTLIDCSSSMTAGDNIERARRFGVLITEAVRALPGVEARFFGFTDSVIYDAGDARDCGVTGLRADGGNNDAAGLFYAANVAMSSRKRAKVLVMISDGLPTSCSVSALRGLVTTLTRRKGIVCAQVAVRKLEEECFPHYVVLDDSQLDVAVSRFGRMIADLTRRALGAS